MSKITTCAALAALSLVICLHSAVASPAWDPEVEDFINTALSPAKRSVMEDFFGMESARPGPVPANQPFGELSQEDFRRGAAFRPLDGRLSKIRVTPELVADADISGSGTQADPYRGLIAAALAKHGERRLVYVIPAGYYEEEGLEIGGSWLEGEQGAVLLAPAESQGARRMITVTRNGGVVGLTLDASARAYDPELGSANLSGIVILESYMAVVADNHLRHIPNNSIGGNGTGALVLNNLVEHSGHSGIRFRGARWLVVNNRVYYAGIQRGGPGALGDDGIIVAGGGDGMIIAHNLVVSERRPNGRHAIGTHIANNNRIENNVVVVKGQLRGGINLSDGSNENRIHRNLILNLDRSSGQAGNGIRTNGQQNSIKGNFIYGARSGINAMGWPATSFDTIEDNFTAVTGQSIRQGPFDTVKNNREETLEH